MNKCKIEVLKTTFDEELAKEYGCKGLGKCPMHKVGEIFYGDYAKPEDYAMKHGRRCTSMFFLFLTVAEYFITEIGLISRVLLSAAVMTVLDLLFSKFRQLMKNLK